MDRAELVGLVLAVQSSADAMRIVDFDGLAQRFFCRQCQCYSHDNKLHDDDCQYKPFVEAMGRLRAYVTAP